MKFRFTSILFGAALMYAAMAPNSSFAVTDCTNKVKNIYAGDSGTTSGYVMVTLDNGSGGNGVSATMNATSDATDTKNIFAIATAALISGKNLTLRFTASGVSCTTAATRTDATGAYLNR